MYKVFFKESCFLLTDDKNSLKEGNYSLTHNDFNTTKNFICHLLEKNDRFKAVICHNDEEDLFGIFKSCFFYVKAAGGAVLQNDEVLLIKRSGIYDLPKGHVETGETIEACAVREVEEECGIGQVAITAPLSTTLHIYPRNNSWYLKKTYWFSMTCPPGQKLVPQTEEDIEEAFWFPISGIPSILAQTYPSLKEILIKIGSQHSRQE